MWFIWKSEHWSLCAGCFLAAFRGNRRCVTSGGSDTGYDDKEEYDGYVSACTRGLPCDDYVSTCTRRFATSCCEGTLSLTVLNLPLVIPEGRPLKGSGRLEGVQWQCR